MRLAALVWGDIRFQYKYGFYLIYLIFSVLYIGLLFVFPETWRPKAAVLLIFSDPAAMGLYFMGAIVLFEKSERVLDSIAVSPVKTKEYVLSKLISLGLISTAAALAIGISAAAVSSPFFFIIGVFLCSVLFSSVGLILASKTSTLNQFILLTIPAELLINVPALFWLFGAGKSWLLIHPGVALMVLLTSEGPLLMALLSLSLWTAFFALIAFFMVKRMLRSLGGVKL